MYREIRVRPVVRYVVTEFHQSETSSGCEGISAEFSNVRDANKIAEMLIGGRSDIVYEPARALRIDWERGPDEQATRWTLSEEATKPDIAG